MTAYHHLVSANDPPTLHLNTTWLLCESRPKLCPLRFRDLDIFVSLSCYVCDTVRNNYTICPEEAVRNNYTVCQEVTVREAVRNNYTVCQEVTVQFSGINGLFTLRGTGPGMGLIGPGVVILTYPPF